MRWGRDGSRVPALLFCFISWACSASMHPSSGVYLWGTVGHLDPEARCCLPGRGAVGRAGGGGWPLRLRGGGGGGSRAFKGTDVSRKGFLLGLKKTAGLKIVMEDPLNPPPALDPAVVATEDAANAGMASRHTREAGEIADMTLRHILALCVPGAKAADICRTGDSYMLNRLRERFPGLVAADTFPDTSKFSTKKHAGARARVTAADLTPRNDTVWCAIKANSSYLATHVGVGFPTCLGIDNICGKYAPTTKDSLTLRDGQVVHLQVACHVHGFVATVAHTISLTHPSGSELTPKQMNVICAAKAGANVLLHSLVPGAKSAEMVDHVEKAILSLGCRAVDGCMTRRIERFSSDGTPLQLIPHRIDQVINDNGMIPPDCDVSEGEVWVIDVLVTTGDGHARMKNFRNTTIFRRVRENKWLHLLSLRYSRDFLGKVIARHPAMPFNMREFQTAEDRAGLGECIKQRLIVPYPVLYERRSEVVARVQMTVVVEASGAVAITSPPDNVQPALNKVSFGKAAGAKGGAYLLSGGQWAPESVTTMDRQVRKRKAPAIQCAEGDADAAAPRRGRETGTGGGVAMEDEDGEEAAAPVAGATGARGSSGGGRKWRGSLGELLTEIAKGGEEAMKRLVPRHRGMRHEKSVKVECPTENGKREEREFAGSIVRLCEEFISPRTRAYRFLDGDTTNLSRENVRWVAAIEVFEAAMLRSEVWATDLQLSAP